MIYIIGDSHVSVFSGTDKTYDGKRHIQPEFGTCYTLSLGQLKEHINRFEQKIPYFCPIKIGSNTAYNSFNKLQRIEQAIEEYNVTKNDYVFLCFGEIDIRNHIGFNVIKNNISIIEGIKICVDKYMETVLYLKNKNINVGVYGSPPSSVGNLSPIDFGDVIKRNEMTIEFNEYLKTKCLENNIPFKDISKKLMLPDGSTDPKYIMDDIHLSQESMPFILTEFSDIINNNLI
jgi:lysophospholipase L1-like esterase|tara:strand:+ start:4174 stop:4869 length:696 start_codon:yes stop_codon:yes gene_type:complete